MRTDKPIPARRAPEPKRSIPTASGVLVAALLVALLPVSRSSDGAGAAPKGSPPRPGPETPGGRSTRPVVFEPNLGQWKHSAAYVARCGAMTVFLLNDGWTFTLEDAREEGSSRGVAVRMTLPGSGATGLAPGDRLARRNHYFLGSDPRSWCSNVPLYGSVRYRNVRPGVDLLTRGQDGHFEFDLLLTPDAPLDEVEVAVEGTTGMHVDDGGALVLETALGPVRMPVPSSWEAGPSGQRSPIACRYSLRGGNRFGFTAPERRAGYSLCIDPGLWWSTFLGGTSLDVADAVAVDAQGTVTVAGVTSSGNFPVSTGAYDTVTNGGRDAYVARLSADGSKVLWCTYLGGSANDQANDVTVDPAGVVTLVGGTASTDFPVKSNYLGAGTGFVARFDPGKTGAVQLVWSTYLGPGTPEALAVDAQGVVNVAGFTTSSLFPTTGGAYDTSFNGARDAFVARIDPARTGSAQLRWSTFLGGGNYDSAHAIAVDAKGVVTVAGRAAAGFPTTTGAYDTTFHGGYDAFVARFDPSQTGQKQLVWSTFLGGTNVEWARGLATDARGTVTVVGVTSSAAFPATTGAFDTSHNGNDDVFVARIDPSRTGVAQLVWATFLGGAGTDSGASVALDGRGAAIVAGVTNSTTFPVTRGTYDSTYAGGGQTDSFIARVSANGADLEYSSYLGGTASDDAHAVALDPRGGVVVVGGTASSTFPTTSGAYDTTYNSNNDGFVTHFDLLPTGVVRYGRSSPGCTGPLAMSVTSMPRIGNSKFALTCGNGPVNANGLLGLAGRALASPVVLLGAGIWVDPTGPWFLVAPARSDAIGGAQFALPIPNDASLINLRLNAQFLWGGPGTPSPCPPTGVSASDALTITIQP